MTRIVKILNIYILINRKAYFKLEVSLLSKCSILSLVS